MFKHKTHILTSAIVLLFAARSLSQEFNNDARLRLNIKLYKKLNKKIESHLYLQNRLHNNMTEYSQGRIDLGFTFKLNKHFRLLTDYVYGKKRNLDGSYSNLHQFYGGILLRKKMNKFVVTYRNMLQAQFKDIYSSEKGRVPKIFERNKLTLKYELNKRFEFYAAQEIITPLNNKEGYYISRSRSYVGAIYNLSKQSSLEGYFMFQRKFDFKSQPERDFIYGFTYSYSF